jgi:Cysteine sulfinate desulfinase/cysteine desulfurase and related enzymes
MTDKRTYLDHAASSPLLPEARAAWLEGVAQWANPSSPHAAGRAARAALEGARERVKAALSWKGEVIFTSGASEALALAISRSKLPLEAFSAVEHDAVLRLAGGARRLPVDMCGRVDAADAAIGALVAVQQVNSETGVLQDLAAIGRAVRGAGGLLLADCAQGAGKLPLPDADMTVIAAHKFGGPIGVGALLVRDWAMLEPSGGQERGYRPGTENLPAVMAMAAALEAGNEWMTRALLLRSRLEGAIEKLGGEVIAVDADRIATIGSYRMPGRSAAAQLIRFDAEGICISAGSACSSGSLKPSHVLEAMAYPDTSEVIRVSIGRETQEEDIDRFLKVWAQIAGRQVPA